MVVRAVFFSVVRPNEPGLGLHRLAILRDTGSWKDAGRHQHGVCVTLAVGRPSDVERFGACQTRARTLEARDLSGVRILLYGRFIVWGRLTILS